MNFKDKLREYQILVNKILENSLANEECYEKRLNDSIRYSLMAGGKRVRPILMLSTYSMFKDNYEDIYPFMIAIEMIHNFSLIHDDLPAIDNDDYRHGKLTNHKKFDESTAILAGDKLLNDAYKLLLNDILKFKEIDVNKLKSINELSCATSKMIIGEYIDTESEGKNISVNLLNYMHENKTGALIETAVKIGALIGYASKDEIEILTSYARNIGLAFQVKDDILDEIGDFNKVGKPVKNDADLNKATFVSMFGLEESQIILKEITNKAIDKISYLGDKADFLIEFACYIRDRDK